MTMLDEVETASAQFTANHLRQIHASFDAPLAMLYSSVMAATIIEFIAKRYGPVAARELLQGLAGHVIDRATHPEGPSNGQASPH